MLPGALYIEISDYLDANSLLKFLHALGRKFTTNMQTQINIYTNQINELGSKRVRVVSFLTRLLVHPTRDDPPPFDNEEGMEMLKKYKCLVRGSRIQGRRREVLVRKLSELLDTRMRLDVPYIPIACPLDIIVAFHFSRLDTILELGGYFKYTEKWLSAINRRATFEVILRMQKQITSVKSDETKSKTSEIQKSR